MKVSRAHPWHLVAGFVIWALWFVFTYGGVAVACQLAKPAAEAGPFNWINLSFLIPTFLIVIYLGICAFKSWHVAANAENESRFLLRVAATSYLASAISTLAVGTPLLAMAPCI